ncbi:SulP family inorganic anion transporter [Nonomuraea sp. SBT364]|uniref:SulP family inorganic anion transporter n=1 Tax=Nonomuraea sp. SBT364 TaxID=1580530 RepID=UPI00066E8384|nr:SulP family inorganic anion transporter [Nonomuraea sp. SBT364]
MSTSWPAVPGWGELRGYRRTWLRPDLLAALSLWAVLVPQAFAYAQLAGLPAAAGLYTALGAIIGYAFFGGARFLNVGPESSVAIVVASALAAAPGRDQPAVAAQLALLIAVFLMIGYVVRAGVLMRLLSTPVLTGYLAGSGVVIIASQLSKVTGIPADGTPLAKTGTVLSHLTDLNVWALASAVLTAAAVLLLGRYAKRLPGPLVALVVATAVVALAGLGDRLDVLGPAEGGLPVPGLPWTGLADTVRLLGPALSIALLVYASSVLTARSMAAKEGKDADPQQEFLGLAAANAGAALLGGFPANGSDSRSALLAGSGARTRLAGLGAAAAVVVTLLVLMPLIRDLPQAALGAVIILTAARLIDLPAFRRLWRIRRTDFVLAAVTALGVLIFGVLEGIVVGVVVSLLEVLRRAVLPYTAVLGRTGDGHAYRDVVNYRDAETLPGLVVYRFDAPLFFANADVLRTELRRLMTDAEPPVRQIVLDAEAVYDMDTTGVEALHRVADDCDRAGARLAFARTRVPVRALMRDTGLDDRIQHYQRVADAVDAYRAEHPGLEPARPGRPRRRGLLHRLRALLARRRSGT